MPSAFFDWNVFGDVTLITGRSVFWSTMNSFVSNCGFVSFSFSFSVTLQRLPALSLIFARTFTFDPSGTFVSTSVMTKAVSVFTEFVVHVPAVVSEVKVTSRDFQSPHAEPSQREYSRVGLDASSRFLSLEVPENEIFLFT